MESTRRDVAERVEAMRSFETADRNHLANERALAEVARRLAGAPGMLLSWTWTGPSDEDEVSDGSKHAIEVSGSNA